MIQRLLAALGFVDTMTEQSMRESIARDNIRNLTRNAYETHVHEAGEVSSHELARRRAHRLFVPERV